MKKLVILSMLFLTLFGMILAAGCVDSAKDEICNEWSLPNDIGITVMSFSEDGTGSMITYIESDASSSTGEQAYEKYTTNKFTWKPASENLYHITFGDGPVLLCSLDKNRGVILFNEQEYVKGANPASGLTIKRSFSRMWISGVSN